MFSGSVFRSFPSCVTVIFLSFLLLCTTATDFAGGPCGQVNATLTRVSPGTAPQVPATLASDCLSSFPINKTLNLAWLDDLRPYLEWHSTFSILKRSPSDGGFTTPSVDLVAALHELRTALENDQFISEYHFEWTVYRLLNRAQDGHLVYVPTLVGSLFRFARPFTLVSVSLEPGNPFVPPRPYLLSDVHASLASNHSFKPSAVTKINQFDAVPFIEGMSHDERLQDFHALYSDAFYTIPHVYMGERGNRGGAFKYTLAYPGENTTLKLQNGTVLNQPNTAYVTPSFQAAMARFPHLPTEGGDTGRDKKGEFTTHGDVLDSLRDEEFAQLQEAADDGQGDDFGEASPLSRRQSGPPAVEQPPLPPLTGTAYPQPLTPQDIRWVQGYYLTPGPGQALPPKVAFLYSSTAVLRITTFDGTNVRDIGVPFIRRAAVEGKKNLIIDLSAEHGGQILMAYHLFHALFPSYGPPVEILRYRAHDALDTIGRIISDVKAEDEQARAGAGTMMASTDASKQMDEYVARQGLASYLKDYSPFTYQKIERFDGSDFANWTDFFGPHRIDFGSENAESYTSLTRRNVSNWEKEWPEWTALGGGFGGKVDGSRSLDDALFRPENIILVSDGHCASTCALLAHFMRQVPHIRTVVVGGHPEPAPINKKRSLQSRRAERQSPYFWDVENFYNGVIDEEFVLKRHDGSDNKSTRRSSLADVSAQVRREAESEDDESGRTEQDRRRWEHRPDLTCSEDDMPCAPGTVPDEKDRRRRRRDDMEISKRSISDWVKEKARKALKKKDENADLPASTSDKGVERHVPFELGDTSSSTWGSASHHRRNGVRTSKRSLVDELKDDDFEDGSGDTNEPKPNNPALASPPNKRDNGHLVKRDFFDKLKKKVKETVHRISHPGDKSGAGDGSAADNNPPNGVSDTGIEQHVRVEPEPPARDPVAVPAPAPNTAPATTPAPTPSPAPSKRDMHLLVKRGFFLDKLKCIFHNFNKPIRKNGDNGPVPPEEESPPACPPSKRDIRQPAKRCLFDKIKEKLHDIFHPGDKKGDGGPEDNDPPTGVSDTSVEQHVPVEPEPPAPANSGNPTSKRLVRRARRVMPFWNWHKPLKNYWDIFGKQQKDNGGGGGGGSKGGDSGKDHHTDTEDETDTDKDDDKDKDKRDASMDLEKRADRMLHRRKHKEISPDGRWIETVPLSAPPATHIVVPSGSHIPPLPTGPRTNGAVPTGPAPAPPNTKHEEQTPHVHPPRALMKPSGMQFAGGTRGVPVLEMRTIYDAASSVLRYAAASGKYPELADSSLGKYRDSVIRRASRASVNFGDLVREEHARREVGGVGFHGEADIVEKSEADFVEKRGSSDAAVPVHFLNEQADCRMWFSMEMTSDWAEVWRSAAESVWGGRNWCVAGSLAEEE